MRTTSIRIIWTILLSLIIRNTYCPAATNTADVEHGRTLGSRCEGCHGSGSLPERADFEVPLIARQSERYLFNALAAYQQGLRADPIMRAQVATLDRQDLGDLSAYFADENQNRDAAAIRALGPGGAETSIPAKVVEICGSCHGETGGGVLPEVPSLAGQRADYLRHALREYRSGARKSAIMAPLARSLSAVEIDQLVEYFGKQISRPFSVALAVSAAPLVPESNSEQPLHSQVSDAEQDPPKPVGQVIREIQMADIPAGTYWMGGDQSEGFAVGSPRHLVHLQAFRIGKTEVTFEQFDAFARETGRALPDDEGWGRGQRPVINVTWVDTQSFIKWLRRKTGRNFRLPSEAEWEYAARGGTATVYWWGDDFRPDYLNARGTNDRDRWLFTAPVGQFPPNPFGLSDTSGNVSERVADCWHDRYVGAPNDGRAWISARCYSRVSRGGSWNLAMRPMRSSARSGTADSIASMAQGFRLAEQLR